VEKDTAPEIELKHNKMILRIRPATNHQTKQVILEVWYRDNLKKAVPAGIFSRYSFHQLDGSIHAKMAIL